jgi:hypothetical protein
MNELLADAVFTLHRWGVFVVMVILTGLSFVYLTVMACFIGRHRAEKRVVYYLHSFLEWLSREGKYAGRGAEKVDAKEQKT